MAKSRKWSEERKQAARDAYAERQNKNPQTPTVEQMSVDEGIDRQEQPVQPTQTTTIDNQDQGDLQRQVLELRETISKMNEQNPWEMLAQYMGVQAGTGQTVQNGKLTGTLERYALGDRDIYPDPSSRLNKEPKLQRFAFPINYELVYEISTSEYTTIDNIRTIEPKFTLQLVRIMMDEETGEPTNGRYIICQLIMHEDPDAALFIARENGLDVNEMDEDVFLNEMRYIRMRDWLLDCFYPPKPNAQAAKREMVIGGKLVTYYEKNTEEDSQEAGIDFSKLPKIKF